jgi:alkanesulfonate monooxygenase SsuD/methylene tetrahydromethanopterin reductase-like flavin-dependent oxidoreductase (luciferase family)
MRALLAGEQVTHRGLVTVERARLWSLPAEPPPLLGAAVSPQTARWLGGWADGLATVHQPRERLARVVEAFREGGGEGKPMLLQVHLSWAGSDEEALRIAHDQWRTNVFAPPLCWDLDTVEHFDEAARHVRPEDMRDVVLVSSDLARHAEWIRNAAQLGFDEVALHHVGKRQEAFIDAAGERLLPELT